MQTVLLDTDVFSFFFKGDTRASRYASDISGRQLCLCFQTVAELRMWAIWRNWNEERREKFSQTLRSYVVLPYDIAMADQWAEVTAHRKRIGKQILCGDAWIVAAALRHEIPLLTHNAKHFEDIPGLVVISHQDQTT